MRWADVFSVGCVAFTTALCVTLLGRFTGRQPARVSGLPGRMDRCQAAGCFHFRYKHHQGRPQTYGRPGCDANMVYPHTDPKTGRYVKFSTCGCDGFMEKSTQDGGR